MIVLARIVQCICRILVRLGRINGKVVARTWGEISKMQQQSDSDNSLPNRWTPNTKPGAMYSGRNPFDKMPQRPQGD